MIYHESRAPATGTLKKSEPAPGRGPALMDLILGTGGGTRPGPIQIVFSSAGAADERGAGVLDRRPLPAVVFRLPLDERVRGLAPQPDALADEDEGQAKDKK